jgi:uncharacterized membrane protein
MTAARLWAIGYEEMQRADQVRREIVRLGWEQHFLELLDVAVVIRHPDGSFTFDRKPFKAAANILGCSATGLLMGLVLGAPLTSALVGALVGGAGSVLAAKVGIGDDFVREVENMMKPGTSALLILDDGGNMDVILHDIRGLGGIVLKSTVDMEQVKLIQSTLGSATADPREPRD